MGRSQRHHHGKDSLEEAWCPMYLMQKEPVLMMLMNPGLPLKTIWKLQLVQKAISGLLVSESCYLHITAVSKYNSKCWVWTIKLYMALDLPKYFQDYLLYRESGGSFSQKNSGEIKELTWPNQFFSKKSSRSESILSQIQCLRSLRIHGEWAECPRIGKEQILLFRKGGAGTQVTTDCSGWHRY